MATNINFIRTDFGVVTLTDKSLSYVGGEAGLAIIRNKRKWGREAKYLRKKMQRLQDTVAVLAEIEFSNGGNLELF